MEDGGKRIVAEGLGELRVALQEYFQVISSLREGYPVVNIPKKPEALIMYDQCTAMGIPIVQGGLRDQPHIWLLEYAICQQEREHDAMMQKANTNGEPLSETTPATAIAGTLRNIGRV